MYGICDLSSDCIPAQPWLLGAVSCSGSLKKSVYSICYILLNVNTSDFILIFMWKQSTVKQLNALHGISHWVSTASLQFIKWFATRKKLYLRRAKMSWPELGTRDNFATTRSEDQKFLIDALSLIIWILLRWISFDFCDKRTKNLTPKII